MQFRPLAEARGFLYCYPDATQIPNWGLCWSDYDEENAPQVEIGLPYVDDAAYLRGLTEEIGRQFVADSKRVYVVGHSMGGSMAYKMARSNAPLLAGVVSLAGTVPFDDPRRGPSEPVNVLHIHGAADDKAWYWGGSVTLAMGVWANIAPFPGAVRLAQTWAAYNGAQNPVTDPGPTLDLTTDVAGLDTVITRHTNCPPGGAVELWIINGASHVPALSSEFSPRVIDWLLAHPKP